MDKKKKKRKIKKKKNKLGGKIPTTAGHFGSDQPSTFHHVGSVDNAEKSSETHRKPKLPCRPYKGDHLLKDFPSIPKVVEVWSQGHQPMSSIITVHVDNKL